MTDGRHPRRYAAIIQSVIGSTRPFAPIVEAPGVIQVERGLRGPIIDLPQSHTTVVDAGGHARPVYRALMVYNWIINGVTARCDDRLKRWIDSLDAEIWSALVRFEAGHRFDIPEWCESASRQFRQLAAGQQPSGALFKADSHANPETRWYEELIALHALAAYAAWVNDPQVTAAVERGALFHLDETQPDHATAQPWALLAFVQYAPDLADQVLHALSMQYPAGVSGVPLLLLTDALYGLRRLPGNDHE